MRRRDAAVVTTLLAVLLAVLLDAGQPAQADPVYPSKNDVRRAQQHAQVVGTEVSRLRAQLARASASVEKADLALSTAAEDYDSAKIELEASRRSAQAATAVAALAGKRLDGAQTQVGRLAAQSYRSGGAVASLDVLLSPSGPSEVLERASMMHTLGEQRQRTVQKMDAARVLATTLDKQAAEAVAKQAAAARKLEVARVAAERLAASAHATLKAEQVTHQALLVKLAAAQKTTVRVVRARQAGLQRAAAARRAAAQRREAARRAAERRAQAQPAPGSGSGGGSGGSGSGGGSGGSSGSGSSGESGGSPSTGGTSSGSSSAGESAVAWAKQQLGLPYQWAADGPGSYDCSGLTMRAWAQAGVQMPHSSRIQYRQVDKISYSQLRPGDLVFFATNPSDEDTIHHVAMYIGGGEMIEAPYTGANVRIVPLRTSDEMPYAGRP